jgi:hypothetical protein
MSEIETKHVLLIISAKTCSACIRLTELGIFQKIKNDFSNNPRVKVIHIELDEMKSNIPNNYPTALNKYKSWFPIFLLINGSDWNDNLNNIDFYNPNIVVFNGVIENGIPKLVDRSEQIGFDSLSKWVSDNIESNDKFRTIISSKTTSVPILPKLPEFETAEHTKYIPTCGMVKFKASRRN